jgi:hypothetical protein
MVNMASRQSVFVLNKFSDGLHEKIGTDEGFSLILNAVDKCSMNDYYLQVIMMTHGEKYPHYILSRFTGITEIHD